MFEKDRITAMLFYQKGKGIWMFPFCKRKSKKNDFEGSLAVHVVFVSILDAILNDFLYQNGGELGCLLKMHGKVVKGPNQ